MLDRQVGKTYATVEEMSTLDVGENMTDEEIRSNLSPEAVPVTAKARCAALLPRGLHVAVGVQGRARP